MSTDKNEDLGKWSNCLRSRKQPVPVAIPPKKMAMGSTAEKPKADRNKALLKKRVFNNELIMDSIFGFLSVDDIKQFRQVCQQWNRMATPFVKQRCAIAFNMPDYSLPRFNELFENSQMGTNFPAIKLTITKTYDNIDYGEYYSQNNEWTLREFGKLLDNRKSSMKQLIINHIHLGLKDYNYTEFFDISQYIEPNLVRLNIGPNVPNMIISTDKCVSTEFLRLKCTQLMLAKDVKINPVVIILKHMTVKQTENGVVSSLSEFVNFDRLKQLTLKNVYFVNNDGDQNRLSLNFKDSLTIRKVELNGEGLDLDFENAKWKITEKLSLSHIEYSVRNDIKFSSLEFEGALLDLAVLPINLKRLKISNVLDVVTRVISSNAANLPELELLHLNVKETQICQRNKPGGMKMPWISHFKNCENLTTVILTFLQSRKSWNNYRCWLDIGLLPASVQKLYVYGKIEFFGDAVDKIMLKQLHVQRSDPSALQSILPLFRGEELVVDLRNFDAPSVYQTVLEILRKPFDRIAVALSHQKRKHHMKFKTSPLYKCTDKFSEFYLFVNKFGNAISQLEFENLFAKEEKMHF